MPALRQKELFVQKMVRFAEALNRQSDQVQDRRGRQKRN
jgi:hypothetical protein